MFFTFSNMGAQPKGLASITSQKVEIKAKGDACMPETHSAARTPLYGDKAAKLC